MKKRYLLILSLCFLFYSCLGGFGGGVSYVIRLYDENNKEINTENELKEFNVSFFDNSNTKAYKDVSLKLRKSDVKCWHELVFFIGTGHYDYQATNFSNKFKDASEYMGIKIEDKKGRYKPVTIYPLSACNSVQEFKPIVVKLEKK